MKKLFRFFPLLLACVLALSWLCGAENTPRVVDNAAIFTEEERFAFESQLSSLREKHGVDFVLYTDSATYGINRDLYAADFYNAGGYGTDAEKSGMILFICMEPGNRGWREAARGTCKQFFTEENVNRLDDKLEPYMADGRYAEGVRNFFTDVDGLFSKGSVPLAPDEYLTRALIAAAISLVIALIVLAILRGRMKAVRLGTEADEYLVKDSFKLQNSRDFFLRTVTTREKIEDTSNSGKSSYSGGYSASDGSSFSGGGRDF